MLVLRLACAGVVVLTVAAAGLGHTRAQARDASELEPVAYWRFDEGEGLVAVDSAGGSNGLVRGATWTAGVSGQALESISITDEVVIDDARYGSTSRCRRA